MVDKLIVREARVSLHVDELALEGHLAIPDEAHALVIFAHGSGSSRHSPRNRFVARRLNEGHLATLLFDLLSEEEDAVDQVTRHLRFDIGLLARRLISAVDFAAGRAETAGMNIGLFGASTGAAAALITAAERTEYVRAVVSRGGRPDLAWESLSDVIAPTLFIVGEMDREVIKLNQLAYEHLNAEKRLHIITGATHLFEEPGTLDAVADQATSWFVQYLERNHVTLEPEINASEPDARRKMDLPNKREILQAIIDEEPEPWIIMKPSRQDPTDPEPLCIFENPAEQIQAAAEIPLVWFQNHELERIKQTVKQNLEKAQVKSRPI